MVAPVLTAASIMSIYSSAGCDFVALDIGFTPSNEAYNRSSASLGLFYYQTGIVHDNYYLDMVHKGCEEYSDVFDEDFIDQDRTWKVSRIMSMIAGIASLVCMILAWLIVFTPLPTGTLWPGLLLPLVMLSFIAEGSKFLIFDIALCSNALWLPSGIDSPAQSAERCFLGQSSIYGIAAASLLLLALLLICLHTPRPRHLDPEYGLTTYSKSGEQGLEPTESAVDENLVPHDPDYHDVGSEYDDDDDDVYINPDQPVNFSIDPEDGGVPDMSTIGDSTIAGKRDTLADLPTPPPNERISESRISKMEEMEMNATYGSDALIHQLVDDLNSSLLDDLNTKPATSQRPQYHQAERFL